MPPTTTMAQLRDADRRGVTGTTIALNTIMAIPGRRAAIRNNLNVAGALSRANGNAWRTTATIGWARNELQRQGLSGPEIDHIRDWLDGQKEQVRVALRTAINDSRGVRFVWHLYHGSREGTTIDDRGVGNITITFLSPWGRLRERAQNDYHVDVGRRSDGH